MSDPTTHRPTRQMGRPAAQPAAHDHLFHTVLGLLGIGSAVYAPDWDLGAPCRAPLQTAQTAQTR